MRVKVFQLAITSAITKGAKHGTIQVIPVYTNHPLLKQPASLHISYSMRNVQRKSFKRSAIFQRNSINSTCQRGNVMCMCGIKEHISLNFTFHLVITGKPELFANQNLENNLSQVQRSKDSTVPADVLLLAI